MPTKTVDAATLKTWLDREEAVLVDVREPEEYEAERIEGACLIPLGAVEPAKLPPHAGKKLVVYCVMGGRSAAACDLLLSEEPALEVYNLKGGLNAWCTAGYPVES